MKQVFPHPAIYPAIEVIAGVMLNNLSDKPPAHGPGLTGFGIRAFEGELRMSESHDAVGGIRWADQQMHVQSSDFAAEHDVKLVCDLDPYRLEKIEEKRAGKGPAFWLQLWPTAFQDGKIIDLTISVIPFRVSLETWADSLSVLRKDNYELIEVRFRPPSAEDFKNALDCVASARRHRDRGAYDNAAGDCRFAFEALQRAVGLRENASKEDWQRLLESGTKARTAKELVGLLASAKGLTHLAHHYKENPDDTFRPEYSRVESGFIIRVTEELIQLVAELKAGAADRTPTSSS